MARGGGGNKKTIPWEEVPPIARDNPYLRTGYRHFERSYCSCVSTAFQHNNQTVNVWSAGLGALLYIVLLGDVLFFNQVMGTQLRDLLWVGPEDAHGDRMFFISWFLGVAAVNAMSCAAHLFSCKSAATFWLWFQFDVSVFCSFGVIQTIGISRYSFRFDPEYKATYGMAALTSALTFLAFLVYWNKYVPQVSKVAKAAVGGVSFFVGCIPVFHRQTVDYSYTWAISLWCLLAGALFFCSLFPERLAPKGSVDVYFWSHPMWHVLHNCFFFYCTLAHLEDFAKQRGEPEPFFSNAVMLVPLGCVGAALLHSVAAIGWALLAPSLRLSPKKRA